MGKHTVEKIGGTSMSQFGDVLKNIIIGKRTDKELYTGSLWSPLMAV